MDGLVVSFAYSFPCTLPVGCATSQEGDREEEQQVQASQRSPGRCPQRLLGDDQQNLAWDAHGVCVWGWGWGGGGCVCVGGWGGGVVGCVGVCG